MEPGEVEKAKAAAVERAAQDSAPPTVFDKIVAKQIPAKVVHEDELCLGFVDAGPQAPVHLLLIPKVRAGMTQLSQASAANAPVLGHMMVVAGELGKAHCPNGFRIVVNDGADGAQSVYHLHLHILGGRQMQWPPG